jgi:hypothetical protein
MFGSETDELCQRVWEAILSKISHINHGRFGFVIAIWTEIVFSTKTPYYDCNEQSTTVFFVCSLPTGGGENMGIQYSYYLIDI